MGVGFRVESLRIDLCLNVLSKSMGSRPVAVPGLLKLQRALEVLSAGSAGLGHRGLHTSSEKTLKPLNPEALKP